MSRQLEQVAEEKSKNRAIRLARVLDLGLSDAVERAGGELLGLSIRYGDFDVLMTIKAVFPAGQMVAFVGAGSMGDCFLKGAREAGNDSLRWKPDRWAKAG